MSARQLADMLGKTVLVNVGEGVSCAFSVDDAKMAYGKVRLHVRPVSGTGAKWIDADRALVVPKAELKGVQRG